MAKPQRKEAVNLHPTLDSDFRDERYDSKNIFAVKQNVTPVTFGIQNPEKVIRLSDYRKKKEPLPQIKSFANEEWSEESDGDVEPTNTPRRPNVPVPVVTENNKKYTVGSKTWATIRGVAVGITHLSWTGFLWFNIQIPFVVINLTSLGLWAQSESKQTTLIGQVTQIATDLYNQALAWIGLEILQFSSMFFISWMVLFALGCITIGGVVLGYLLSFLHPMSGRGAGVKTILLGLCVVGYSIPGFNLIPWIWLYIFFVMRYPK